MEMLTVERVNLTIKKEPVDVVKPLVITQTHTNSGAKHIVRRVNVQGN
jgi:hypothetical protein